MKKSKKKILIPFLIFLSLVLLSFSIILANNSFEKTNVEINKEKIYYEIKYLDSEIINMINLLNNIQNKPNFYINWSKLENRTYILYNYWNSIILDLSYLNIDKKNLTSFGKKLDELLFSINNKNKNSALINLIELYNKLIIYSEYINLDEYNNILVIKYNLLCAYGATENENWTLSYEYILKATNCMMKILNSLDVNSNLQYNINQAYVSLKELENIIYIKDLNIFNFKYRIVINKLDNLTF